MGGTAATLGHGPISRCSAGTGHTVSCAGYYLDIFRNYEKIDKIKAPAMGRAGCGLARCMMLILISEAVE